MGESLYSKSFLKQFNANFVIVPFGISPTEVEIKAHNYAFKDTPYCIRSWLFKNFKEQFSQHKIAQWTDHGVTSQA